MDGSTIWIVLIVVAIIAFFMFRRNRPAPRGTYDDPKVSSSGSIGGGPRAHDDPKVSSSGSIGGGPRAYDSPDVKSGGSLGNLHTGDTSRETTNRISREDRDAANARRPRTAGGPNDEYLDEDERDRPTHDDRAVKSSGSFGSSS